ncbi:MAG: hypothetical protein ACP5IJ_00680 [Candidatus Nanoarchaeia archaeon]
MALFKKTLFKKSELGTIAAIILLLAFGFSYRFEGPPTLTTWAGNFLICLIAVTMAVLVHEVAHKVVGAKLHIDVEPKLWISGIVALLLGVLFSHGLFVFAAPWAVAMRGRALRPGMPWPHISPKEKAVVAVAGILANLAFAIVAKLLVPFAGPFAEKLISINCAIAVYNLVPFFTILPILAFQWSSLKRIEAPYIEGEYVFFGNRPLWAFVFVFAILLSISLKFLSIGLSLLISILGSIGLWIVWHYFFEPAPEPKGPWPIKSSLIATEEGPTIRTYKKIAKGLK